jgi:hypothetical protein
MQLEQYTVVERSTFRKETDHRDNCVAYFLTKGPQPFGNMPDVYIHEDGSIEGSAYIINNNPELKADIAVEALKRK